MILPWVPRSGQLPGIPPVFEEGQYLVGVYAVDDDTQNEDGMKHVTFSYLTDNPSNPYYAYPEHRLSNAGTPLADEIWYANPDPDPGVQMGTFVNTCGTTAISKTSDQTEYNAGGLATFTITIKNTLRSPLTISSITDSLPPVLPMRIRPAEHYLRQTRQ